MDMLAEPPAPADENTAQAALLNPAATPDHAPPLRRRRTRSARQPVPPEAQATAPASAALSEPARPNDAPLAMPLDGPTPARAAVRLRSLTLAELALLVLRREVVAIRERRAAVRLSDDPEAVHQLRVALRRLRAALTLFAAHLPTEVSAFRAEFAWLAHQLGAVRDRDVLLDRLRSLQDEAVLPVTKGLTAVMEHLEAERRAARARLLAALDSDRYEQLLSRFSTLLEAPLPPETPDAAAPALERLPDLLVGRHRRLRRAAAAAQRKGSVAAYHRARIRGKRLRYALEFAGEVYGPVIEPLRRRLSALQDVLGQLQDAEVGLTWLRGVAKRSPSGEISSDEGVRAAIMWYRRRRKAMRAAFPAAMRAVTRKHWQRLRVVLAVRRARLLAQSDLNEGTPPQDGNDATAERAAD